MSASMGWAELEKVVQQTARDHFLCDFVPDKISGVQFDAVGYPKPNRCIVIEVSKQDNLDKRSEERRVGKECA